MKVAKCSELNKLFTHSQAPKNSDPAKNDPLPQVKKRVAVLVLSSSSIIGSRSINSEGIIVFSILELCIFID